MKPKETKEELKMKNKNLVKKVAVVSLAALISIPNIVGSTSTYAAYNQEYESYLSLGNIISSVNQGNYTLLTDSDGEQGLVHTSQWNEYQLMLNQGSPKVTQVWIKGSASGFYGITAYQLAGQQKVTLPENAVIKVTDNYNLDHLSVLKYLGNQLGQSYLFNVNNALEKEKQKIQQENAKIAAEYAKQQAENQRSAEESARNAQINAEMDIWDTKGKFKHNSQLPYTLDYMNNYVIAELTKCQEKLWPSFDNERNYVQQWLDEHNLTMKQLYDMNYTTVNLEENSKKYGKQMYQANKVYFKWIENGTLPKNCSYGDWTRYVLKHSNWPQIVTYLDIWALGKVDFSIVTEGKLNHWATYEDIYRINLEVYEMIRKDFTTIANYKVLTKEDCIHQVEHLCTALIGTQGGTKEAKKRNPQYQSRTDLHKKLAEEFATKYLPNLSLEPGNLEGLTEGEKEYYKLK